MYDKDINGKIESLSKDQRLLRIFNHKDISCLNLWVLDLKIKDNKYNCLLYGFVIPSTVSAESNDVIDEWYSKNCRECKLKGLTKGVKFHVNKLIYYNKGSTILDLILEIFKGFNLEKSCKNVGLNIPKVFKNLTINSTKAEYAVRPVVFLEAKESLENIVETLKPLESPLTNTPAFMGSLFRLDKSNIFPEFKQKDKLIKTCILCLKKETGLNFNGPDSPRLGNIEFISYPAASDYGISKVLFKTVKKEQNTSENGLKPINTESVAKEVKVKILNDGSLNGTDILVRCRLRNGRDITLDQCKEVTFNNESDLSVYFKAEEDVGQIMVTVWKRDKTEDPWEIFYENSNSILREIFIYNGITSGYGKSKLDLLYKIKSRKPRVKEKTEDLKKVKHVDYTRSVISGYQFDPWVPISNDTRVKAHKLFPEHSGGRFFPSWLQEGTLEFISWFKSLVNETNTSEILIVDPYFDNVGIELISDTMPMNTTFTVLMDTKKRSHDDPQKDGSPDPRIERIKKSYIGHNFRSNVQVFNLVNEKASIHDRCILMFDWDGNLKKGYHLSNSLQNATKSHPLLVTPIPNDLLADVNNYINHLIENVDPTLIESSQGSIPELEENKELLDNIPNSNTFFKALTQDEGIEKLNTDQLSNHLKKIGLITAENKFKITGDICSQAGNFAANLTNSSDPEFLDLWNSLGEWLARVTNPEKYLEQLIESGKRDELVEKLHNFFLDALKLEFTLNPERTDSFTVLEKNFKEILKTAGNYVEYNRRLLLGKGLYSLEFGACALFYLNPNVVLEILSEVSKRKDAQNSTKHVILEVLLVEIIRGTSPDNKDLLKILLGSEIPLIRAIGSEIITLYSKKDEKSLQEAFEDLHSLNIMENLHVLAQWVTTLRQRNRGSEEVIKCIFNEMIQLWPEKMPAEDLKDLNNRLGGPSKINWSSRTSNGLLIPLINKNKLKIDDFTILWFDVLFKQLEDVKSGGDLVFTDVDREFTETCGYSLAISNNQNSYLERLRKFIDNYMTIIRTPFKRSIDYKTWRDALRCLLWIQAVVNCSRTYKNETKLKNVADELDEVWNYVSPEYINRDDLLLEFACKAKKRLKQ